MNDSLKGISTCLRGAILEEKYHIFIIYSSYNNIDKDFLVKNVPVNLFSSTLFCFFTFSFHATIDRIIFG